MGWTPVAGLVQKLTGTERVVEERTLLCCAVLHEVLKNPRPGTHLVSDRREFSSPLYLPTVQAAAQAPETVVVVDTTSYAELSH